MPKIFKQQSLKSKKSIENEKFIKANPMERSASCYRLRFGQYRPGSDVNLRKYYALHGFIHEEQRRLRRHNLQVVQNQIVIILELKRFLFFVTQRVCQRLHGWLGRERVYVRFRTSADHPEARAERNDHVGLRFLPPFAALDKFRFGYRFEFGRIYVRSYLTFRIPV